MILIAHNIRSLHNVGSLFRSADAFGVECLYLTGYTGTPPRKEIAKVSLGSEDRVMWEHREDIFGLLTELRKGGRRVLALETDTHAAAVGEVSLRTVPLALIVGNEVSGIESDVLAAADGTVTIPMPGRKRSLNVSVAAGIALYALSQK